MTPTPTPNPVPSLHSLTGQAQSRAYTKATRRFARTLAPPPPGLEQTPPPLVRRWATIASIQVSTMTVTITLDGSNVAGISFLSSYMPVVNDAVVVDFLGEDAVVVGSLATSARGPGGAPPGIIDDAGSGTVPFGYLLCNGAAVSRTIYAALFAVIGTSWGPGDGSTTFNLPDLRGRTTIGAGTGSGLTTRALAATGGEEANAHTHGSAAHNHTLSANGQAQYTSTGTGAGVWMNRVATASYTPNIAATPTSVAGTVAAQTLGVALAGTTDSGTPGATGGPSDSSNMPPFAVTTKVIKA